MAFMQLLQNGGDAILSAHAAAADRETNIDSETAIPPRTPALQPTLNRQAPLQRMGSGRLPPVQMDDIAYEQLARLSSLGRLPPMPPLMPQDKGYRPHVPELRPRPPESGITLADLYRPPPGALVDGLRLQADRHQTPQRDKLRQQQAEAAAGQGSYPHARLHSRGVYREAEVQSAQRGNRQHSVRAAPDAPAAAGPHAAAAGAAREAAQQPPVEAGGPRFHLALHALNPRAHTLGDLVSVAGMAAVTEVVYLGAPHRQASGPPLNHWNSPAGQGMQLPQWAAQWQQDSVRAAFPAVGQQQVAADAGAFPRQQRVSALTPQRSSSGRIDVLARYLSADRAAASSQAALQGLPPPSEAILRRLSAAAQSEMPQPSAAAVTHHSQQPAAPTSSWPAPAHHRAISGAREHRPAKRQRQVWDAPRHAAAGAGAVDKQALYQTAGLASDDEQEQQPACHIQPATPVPQRPTLEHGPADIVQLAFCMVSTPAATCEQLYDACAHARDDNYASITSPALQHPARQAQQQHAAQWEARGCLDALCCGGVAAGRVALLAALHHSPRFVPAGTTGSGRPTWCVRHLPQSWAAEHGGLGVATEGDYQSAAQEAANAWAAQQPAVCLPQDDSGCTQSAAMCPRDAGPGQAAAESPFAAAASATPQRQRSSSLGSPRAARRRGPCGLGQQHSPKRARCATLCRSSDSTLADLDDLSDVITADAFAELSMEEQRRLAALLPAPDRSDVAAALSTSAMAAACGHFLRLLKSGLLEADAAQRWLPPREREPDRRARREGTIRSWAEQHFGPAAADALAAGRTTAPDLVLGLFSSSTGGRTAF